MMFSGLFGGEPTAILWEDGKLHGEDGVLKLVELVTASMEKDEVPVGVPGCRVVKDYLAEGWTARAFFFEHFFDGPPTVVGDDPPGPWEADEQPNTDFVY